MANTTTAIGNYRLPNLDYTQLNGRQREALVELIVDMKKVRKAVEDGEFESLVTVEKALDFLSEKASLLGSELPDSFVQEVRSKAITRSLERSERYPQVVREGGRLVEQARESLQASDQGRYRFFSGRARDYYERHRLPTDELDVLEEKAAINPFFTSEDAPEAPQTPKARVINPFE
jgi:hypothetical protein